MEVGASGQFDVLVDGVLVASRAAGFMTRLMGGGWPNEDEVVEAVRSRQRASS